MNIRKMAIGKCNAAPRLWMWGGGAPTNVRVPLRYSRIKKFVYSSWAKLHHTPLSATHNGLGSGVGL